MSRSATVRESIFDEMSQFLKDVDPEQIKPLYDRVLVRDLPEEVKVGSLFIPGSAASRGVGKRGLLRMAQVVALGPGDPFKIEKQVHGGTQVIRKAYGKCWVCGGRGTWFTNPPVAATDTCRACGGDGIHRFPMQVKVGDTVVIDRRREGEFYIDKQRYTLCHEEQAVMGVVEEGQFRPIHDRISARRVDTHKQTFLEVPESAKKKSQFGVVIAVGPGGKRGRVAFKPGDKIMFEPYADGDVTLPNEEVLILQEKQVLGVLE